MGPKPIESLSIFTDPTYENMSFKGGRMNDDDNIVGFLCSGNIKIPVIYSKEPMLPEFRTVLSSLLEETSDDYVGETVKIGLQTLIERHEKNKIKNCNSSILKCNKKLKRKS